MEEKSGLTQEGLMETLHRRGYADATHRQIVDWRSRGILPPFDLKGAGRGRSSGRAHSRWADADLIMEQAIWTLELLNLYGNYSQVYIPLWLLGYSIEPHHIRQALSAPLERTISNVERECSSERNMEDVLSDTAHSLTARLKQEQFPVCDVTQDAMDLILNVFMNPNYDMTDTDAFGALQSWLQHCERSEMFQSIARKETDPNQPSTLNSGVRQVLLIQKHLSLPEIKRAVDECGDDEILVVEHDLESLRHVVCMVERLLSAELPGDLIVPLDMVWRFVLGLGRVMVCIDLSLRKQGFGKDIDSLLSELLARVQTAFDLKFSNVRTQSSAA